MVVLCQLQQAGCQHVLYQGAMEGGVMVNRLWLYCVSYNKPDASMCCIREQWKEV